MAPAEAGAGVLPGKGDLRFPGEQACACFPVCSCLGSHSVPSFQLGLGTKVSKVFGMTVSNLYHTGARGVTEVWEVGMFLVVLRQLITAASSVA